MKLFKRVIYIAVITFLFISINVYAAEKNVSFVGNNEVENEKVETINIKISSDEEIGVIEGVLKTDSNIEITEFKTNITNFTLTYNDANGKFNAVYAKGLKSGEVLQIKYKLKNGAKSRKYFCGKH